MFSSSLLLLCASSALASLTYRGVDWSSAPLVEDSGITYKAADGTATAIERILADSGVNTVRQRLWVNPSNGDYNLDYNIALAKRAHKVGMGIYLDMHFSDTWASPSAQVSFPLP